MIDQRETRGRERDQRERETRERERRRESLKFVLYTASLAVHVKNVYAIFQTF